MKNISRILILTILLNFSLLNLNVSANELGIKVEYDPNGGIFQDGSLENKFKYGQVGDRIETYYNLEQVTREGYEFQGWDLIISKVPYASLTINYVDEKDNKILETRGIDNRRIGEKIFSIDYKKEIEGYELIRVDKDEIILGENDNSINFYYRKNKVEEKVKYTIKYLVKGTNKSVFKNISSAERQEDLIFEGKAGDKVNIGQYMKKFDGYIFNNIEPTSGEIILNEDEGKNIIKFFYAPEIIITPPGEIDFGMFGYSEKKNEVIASSKDSLIGLLVPKEENIILEEGKNYKLKANWKKIENKSPVIRLHSNGGSFDNMAETIYTITSNNGIKIKDVILKKPVRKGYSLKGWTLDAEGKMPLNYEKTLAYNEVIDIYAKWELDKATEFKVTYNGNGNTSGNAPLDSKTYFKGDSVIVFGNESLRRDKHSFKGWSTSASASRIDYRSGDTFSITSNVSLYAVWDKDSSGGGGDKEEPEKTKPPVKEKTKDKKGRDIGKILEPKIEYELNKDDHFAYIEGYKDNTVKPNGHITREEVAVVFYRLMEPEYRKEIETTDYSYTDIDENRWSTKAIATLSNGEILKGYNDGTFKPTDNMTRAEIAKAIARFTDTVVLETQMPDIIGHWAEDYINTVEKEGWVKGYKDGTFKPNELLTRAEFVTIMNSLLDRKVKKENILPGLKEFKDLEEEWYYEQMIEAINGHNYELKRLEDGTEKWTELVDTEFPN